MSGIRVDIKPTGKDGRVVLQITADAVDIAAMLGSIMTHFDNPAAVMDALERATYFPFREGI